ncbi:hypothetical protein ACGFS9_17690 [Streptomyces sp. NPDC048566]|uniref:hypothetical protein n=1 Tax=Streptomyces sp. NPDC048566 TaxID=3365569 RepID=UPI003712D3E7
MDSRTWDALVDAMKDSYATGVSEGAAPVPVIMPLVRGALVGLVWLRPVRPGTDALTGIAALSNIAAAAGADEVVLAWESRAVAALCEVPTSEATPCLTMVHATADGHVLHRFPYTEVLSDGPDGSSPQSTRIDWTPAPAPRPGGELVAPVRAAVDYAFTPMDMDHPNPFGVTVLLMEEDGYTVRLTETLDG